MVKPHSGKSNAREMGRKGGLVKEETPLRREAKEDDELREQARQTLRRALAGEDLLKACLDAARSLFSYRPEIPEREREAPQRDARQSVFSLVTIIAASVERGILQQLDLGLDAEDQQALVAILKRARPPKADYGDEAA